MSNKNAEGKPVACDHEWTDDGGFLLVCMKCEAQEDRDPKWRDMESAPTDGTLLRLLVNFDEHPTEDADEAQTIGANNFDNDGEDVWQFAGWCWSHDHFTQGVGTPVGWLPMIDTNPGTAELDRVTAERDALQQRLNAVDQRADDLAEMLALASVSVDYHAGMKGEDGEHLYDLLARIRASFQNHVEHPLAMVEQDHVVGSTEKVAQPFTEQFLEDHLGKIPQ